MNYLINSSGFMIEMPHKQLRIQYADIQYAFDFAMTWLGLTVINLKIILETILPRLQALTMRQNVS